jgi:hypothetical protein
MMIPLAQSRLRPIHLWTVNVCRIPVAVSSLRRPFSQRWHSFRRENHLCVTPQIKFDPAAMIRWPISGTEVGEGGIEKAMTLH